MNVIITYYNLLCTLISMLLSLVSIYRSSSILIKETHRDVRELLTKDIIRYEKVIRRKQGAMFLKRVAILMLMTNRLVLGCPYISYLDMWTWVILSSLILYIGWVDYSTASPENE